MSQNPLRPLGLLLAICAITLQAFERNPILTALPDTSWVKLQDRYSCGRSLCAQTMDFSGMVYDHHRHKILMFGGGHATQFWNQTEEFDFKTLTWKQLNRPDTCTFYNDSTRAYKGDTVRLSSGRDSVMPDGGTIGYGGDKRPISRHTYDGLHMLPDTCLLLMSAAHCDKGGCMTQDYYSNSRFLHDNYYWLFDPVAVKWTRLTADAIFCCPAEVDPVTGDCYVKHGESTRLYKYDWKTRTRSLVNSTCPLGWEIEKTLTYNPLNRSMLLFGATNIYQFDIASRAWTTKNPAGRLIPAQNRAVPFDTMNQVFGIFRQGEFSYYSPLTNAWYNLPYDTTRFPKNPAYTCTVYDPVDNAFILLAYNGFSAWTTWAYKLSDTPGRFPGTRNNTLDETGKPSVNASLRLTATPNPFVSSVRLRLEGPAGALPGIVRIYDVAGRQIARNALGGRHSEVTWGKGANGSGLYLAVFSDAAGRRISKPLLATK